MASDEEGSSLQEVLERAQMALQEALDALSTSEDNEAASLDAPVRSRVPIVRGDILRGVDLQKILAGKRAAKLGSGSGVAGLNIGCDEGC